MLYVVFIFQRRLFLILILILILFPKIHATAQIALTIHIASILVTATTHADVTMVITKLIMVHVNSLPMGSG